MIAYKYVIKRLNQYYPLLNFGIDRKIKNAPRYRLGKIYNKSKNFKTIKTELGAGKGYHFFKHPYPKGYNWDIVGRKHGSIKDDWENYFFRIFHRNLKITILKCMINKIVTENETRIVAKEFKILGEVI